MRWLNYSTFSVSFPDSFFPLFRKLVEEINRGKDWLGNKAPEMHTQITV